MTAVLMPAAVARRGAEQLWAALERQDFRRARQTSSRGSRISVGQLSATEANVYADYREFIMIRRIVGDLALIVAVGECSAPGRDGDLLIRADLNRIRGI